MKMKLINVKKENIFGEEVEIVKYKYKDFIISAQKRKNTPKNKYYGWSIQRDKNYKSIYLTISTDYNTPQEVDNIIEKIVEKIEELHKISEELEKGMLK